MDKQKPKSNTKSKHSSKHVKDTPVSKQRKLLTVVKIILYSFVWLIAWGAIAFGMAVVLTLFMVFSIAQDGVITPQQANNSVLVVILIIGALFLGTVWLMRKAKSLFYRTSRYVLLICTIIGLLAGVPMSLLGVWQPDVDSSSLATSVDKKEPELKRYQYMLCTDGSYRGYTDEQMKDPDTGLTSESEDYCKKNGQGKILRLTNSLEEAKANGKKATARQQYAPPQNDDCHAEDIPYKSVRKPSSTMYVGEEYVVSGDEGAKYVCKDRSGQVTSSKVWYSPDDEITYYGTKPPRQEAASRPNVDLNALCAHTPANSTFRGDCMERYRKQYYGN